jgi:hypothetical protein
MASSGATAVILVDQRPGREIASFPRKPLQFEAAKLRPEFSQNHASRNFFHNYASLVPDLKVTRNFVAHFLEYGGFHLLPFRQSTDATLEMCES